MKKYAMILFLCLVTLNSYSIKGSGTDSNLSDSKFSRELLKRYFKKCLECESDSENEGCDFYKQKKDGIICGRVELSKDISMDAQKADDLYVCLTTKVTPLKDHEAWDLYDQLFIKSGTDILPAEKETIVNMLAQAYKNGEDMSGTRYVKLDKCTKCVDNSWFRGLIHTEMLCKTVVLMDEFEEMFQKFRKDQKN